MGMVPLALYLRGAGVRVEAFDDRFIEPLRGHLIDHGVKVLDELNPIKNPECIVYSSAISRDDDRLKKFKDDGVPLFRRGDFLAALFSRHKIIAVVGSHGKTSVSGRLAWAFHRIGFDTSYLVGGQFKNFTLPCGFYSKSKWVVIEVDESDGSIDQFSPWITVCLNCDWDHVDQYADSLSFADTLKSLFERTQEAVVYADSPSLLTLVSRQKIKIHIHSKVRKNLLISWMLTTGLSWLSAKHSVRICPKSILKIFPVWKEDRVSFLILQVELFLRIMPTIQVKSRAF